MKRNNILNRTLLASFINELQSFHGQEVYSGLGPAIARKKTCFRYIFPLIDIISHSRLMNFFLLSSIILGYRVFRYPCASCRIFEYGISRNNIISFKRLNHCLSLQGVTDVSMNEQSVSISARLKTICSIRLMFLATCELTNNRGSRPLVHLQTLIGCSAILLYSCKPLPTKVEVVCIASDHSPISQALIFLAKREGRKTCYIQHAPVNNHFPPLTYDLSILYDRASFLAYKASALRHSVSPSTSVVLLSPFEDDFNWSGLNNEPYNVGICLSFLPNLDELLRLLLVLSSSSFVKKILIRSHPRCRIDLSSFFDISKVERGICEGSASEFFKTVDFVLVPNSGVTIEALHSGRPAFFTPGLDELPDDYYGFVSSGIVPIFKSDDLAYPDKLASFFNKNWVKRFSEYDETINHKQREMYSVTGRLFVEYCLL